MTKEHVKCLHCGEKVRACLAVKYIDREDGEVYLCQKCSEPWEWKFCDDCCERFSVESLTKINHQFLCDKCFEKKFIQGGICEQNK